MYRFLILLVFLTFTPLLCLAQVDNYESMVVERIEIVVTNQPPGTMLHPSTVLSRITTAEGRFFSQAEFDQDLKALDQEFSTVVPSVEVINGRLFITLEVTLKPTIRSIQWFGQRSFTIGKLQSELGVRPGEIYEQTVFQSALQKLRRFYIKKGYFESEICFETELDPVTNEADIFITINEGRCGKIKEIVFHNFTQCEQEEVTDLMVTKKWNFFTSWFYDDGFYAEDMVRYDEMNIINYLQNQGYSDADVSIDVEEDPCSGKILLHITADKGELYRFGTITWEGNTLYSDEEIELMLRVRTGCPYSPDLVRESLGNVTELYGKCGYIDTFVDFEPELDVEEPVYHLHMIIEEGEQYRVGLIKIFGNCATKNSVILHETPLVPGELFDSRKLKKAEERLRCIGYFSNVNVYTVRSEEFACLGENYRDVHIEVEETSTGSFSAFAGFSSLEDAFGGVNITESNFNILGIYDFWRQGFSALRGGGEYAYASISAGTKSRKYIFSWTKPYFMDTPWIVGFDFEEANVRYMTSAYYTDSTAYTVHGKYPVNDFVRFGLHYRAKNSKVTLKDQATAPPDLVEAANNSGLVSAAGFSLIYDSSDNPKCPTCGFRSRLETEYAGLGGDFDFLNIAYFNTWYYPTSKNTVFRTRANVHFILPVLGMTAQDIPINERLFLGGGDNVRGYRDFSIGPKYDGTSTAEGGISLGFFSLEWNWRYSDCFEPFYFFDMGTISQSKYSFGDFKTSVGLGARLTIMSGIPPITLGLGFPINDTSEHDTRLFFFNVGGAF